MLFHSKKCDYICQHRKLLLTLQSNEPYFRPVIYVKVINVAQINRQKDENKHYYSAVASRRNNAKYVHSDEEVLNRYYGKICNHGNYPSILADAMGDRFFMAKFDNEEEVEEYRQFTEARL
jgi:hypothetical protein